MSRKANIERTIQYLFKDEAKLKAEGHKPITIRRNIRTRKLENIIKEFKANESLRVRKSSNAVKLYHTVISFHKKDSKYLDEKAMKDFAKEYMKLKGENMYLATAHYDKGHMHLHICESGTGYLTGKANRISQAQFKELKVAMQDFQLKKYSELSNSLAKHGQGKTVKEIMKDTRQSQKQSLLDCLKRAELTSKNLDDFLNHLRQSGHEPYYRGEKLAGIKYDGDTKFRFSNLGYKEKVEELSQGHAKDQQELQELEDLRSGSADREKEPESRTRELDQDEDKDKTEPDIENDNDDYSR